ncbi:MAG: N-acetyltransferase [Enhygromyxa sp.]
MPLTLRYESPQDAASIFTLNRAAFETDAEARLVDALRAAGGLSLSLVAELDGRLVGHIAFSPVTVSDGDAVASGVGLGPMAVLPELQRQGIGGALVTEGLRRLGGAGLGFCVVLGHAEYYPRFGFERASSHGIRWEHDVPEDVFFVQSLRPGGLEAVRGVVRYRAEFDGL